MESVVTTSREIRLSERILETARGLLFRYGYKTLTMDLLARELGSAKRRFTSIRPERMPWWGRS